VLQETDGSRTTTGSERRSSPFGTNTGWRITIRTF
jgi:hypothetical protein